MHPAVSISELETAMNESTPSAAEPAVTSKATAEHYLWAGACDGWHLVKGADLSVIHERMPAGSAETRHYHTRARQFFFVLSGTLAMEREGVRHVIAAGQGLEVPPGQRHQAVNTADETVEFLVISSPTTRGDRIESP